MADRNPTNFQPAKREAVSQIILDQLLDRIRDGNLRPGDRLPTEIELMELFKVGRSSVREALRGLITLGLIETKPGRGAIIRHGAESPLARVGLHVSVEQLNARSLLDLLEVREALEGQAAEYAARRSTSNEVKQLRLLQAAVERDIRRRRTYFKTNAAFHTGIARAARNSVLAESIRLLASQVRGYRERLMRELPAMPQQDIIEHRAIVDAIAAGAPETAREAMVTHIRSFSKLVLVADQQSESLPGPDRTHRRATAEPRRYDTLDDQVDRCALAPTARPSIR
jgi:GntR family transcriptional repressor for pyruvate dehydrogenase complex